MKRIALFFAFLVFVGLPMLQAQTVQITGKITSSEDGSPVPGVSVLVKGTTVGTTTDLDGKYSLNVPSSATDLVFSFVGMKTQEVAIGGRNSIDITLETDAIGLEEVVVTALGIKRSEKSVGYATTSVSNEEITKARSTNIMNSLQGKVAGVSISSSSGAPGASTKVILRGYSSVLGSNQPLYIVDGNPISNTTNNFYLGDNDVSRSQDFGNKANDINPDDIENVTILKGASATALYGSRAANGVIMITTKSGKASDKIKVEVSSSATFSEPLRITQFQNSFGQGWSGHFAFEENGSWGPMLDGKLRLWGNEVEGERKMKPFSAQKNNLRDFFDTGKSYNNSISFSGGKDNASYYISYGNITEDGIVPTDADSYKRHTLTMNGSIKGKKLSVTSSLNYMRKDASAVSTGQGASDGGATLYQELIQIPRDMNITEFKDYKNPYNNIGNYFTAYADNPYFVLNENGNEYNEDRVYGNVKLDYKLVDWLTATWRLGADVSNGHLKDWGAIAKTPEGSPNDYWGRSDVVGRVNERSIYNYEINSDFLLSFNKTISDFSINAILGYNANERYDKSLYGYVTDLDIPGFYNLSNSSVAPKNETEVHKRRLYGVLGSADIGYKEMLFLTLNARNDWSSTLPKNNNSFFYPGVTLAFLFSELMPSFKDILPYGKIRASWGKTGNDADPYLINSVMVASEVYLPFGQVKFPINGVNAFEVSRRIGNNNLQPEITSEYEFGAEVKFFENRLGFDFAYYDQSTTDQIMIVPLATSSGYSSQILNLGEVENKGIELTVNLVPIKTNSFTWDFSWNFSKNKNKVVELSEQLQKVTLNSAYSVDFVAKVGKPLGVFEGPVPALSPDGKVIVNAQGIPISDPIKQEYGTSQAKFNMGFQNTFTYKNLSLSATLDLRKGGLFYCYSSQLNYFVGNASKTTFNERQPFLVPNSVQEVQGSDGTITYVENTTPITMSRVSSYWYSNSNNNMYRESVLDRSFVKLREVIISYNFPKKLFSKTPISNITLSAIGKNLLLWTPKENNFVDPESTTWGNDLDSEFGEFAVGPSVRSFGGSLKITF